MFQIVIMTLVLFNYNFFVNTPLPFSWMYFTLYIHCCCCCVVKCKKIQGLTLVPNFYSIPVSHSKKNNAVYSLQSRSTQVHWLEYVGRMSLDKKWSKQQKDFTQSTQPNSRAINLLQSIHARQPRNKEADVSRLTDATSWFIKAASLFS